MIKAAIFGAGQGGIAIKNLISDEYEIVVYFDNNRDKSGSFLSGIIIETPDKIKDYNPDIIWTGTLNADAAIDIEKQIRDLGYKGRIKHASQLKKNYDIRLAELRLITDEIKERNVVGEIAELGVYQGKFARELNRNFPERKLYLFDTFEGFQEKDIKGEKGLSFAKKRDFSDTSVEHIQEKLLHPKQAVILKGRFPETIPREDIHYALVSLDADLYEPTLRGLEYFYPQLSSGGVILIHDYNSVQFPGVKKAVKEYTGNKNLFPVPLCDFHGTAILIKQ